MPSCPPLRGLQNLLRPTSIRMARHQELFKATTTHSPMTLTAIQNCRHVSIADRSLPYRRLRKKVQGNPNVGGEAKRIQYPKPK